MVSLILVCFYRIPWAWNGFCSILHLVPCHETMEGWTKLQHGWQDAGRDVGTSRPKSQNSVLYCSSSAQPNCFAFHLLGAVLSTQAFFSACHGKISQLAEVIAHGHMHLMRKVVVKT